MSCEIIQFSTAARVSPKRRKLDQEPERPARDEGELSTTAGNGRLRKERQEVWQMAEAATRYWRLRIDFQSAVSWAQRMEIPEGHFHPSDPEERDRMSTVQSWRAALVKQLLTPAWDVASVKWKQAAVARGEHCYTGVKTERIERAIADDIAFLDAHPTRRSSRRSAAERNVPNG